MGLWRRYLDWRRRHVAAIELTPGGFRLSHGGASQAVAWDDVRRITAFKRDLVTYDCICLLLETGDGLIEVDEEMPGFAAWRDSLDARFALSPRWFIKIMTPAFDTSPRDLYHCPALTEHHP